MLWRQAIQLTYYRLHKELTATYETGHTRLFYHGRTETIKALTTDSVAFVQGMDDPTLDVRIPTMHASNGYKYITNVLQ
jgi:hypothetical protein